MTNAWIAGLILLLVAVAVVIPTVQTSISKATVPYYFVDTNDTTSPFAGTYTFSHRPILNGTESCFNATSAANTLTRNVNYTMDYWNGVLTNVSISPAWTA